MKKVWKYGITALLIALFASGTLCGCSFGSPTGPVPSDGVGEEVTAEEWTAAFDEANFTNYQASLSTLTLMGTGEKMQVDETIRFDGNKGCMDFVVNDVNGTSSYTTYFVKNDDGSYIGYRKNSAGKWETTKEMEAWSQYIMERTTRERYHLMYGAYKYDAAEGGYVKTEIGGKSVIKIKDGKLISIYQEQSISTPEGTASGTTKLSYTYGGQTVTLPVVEESPAE